MAAGTLFSEVSMSIGKVEIAQKKQSVYSMGFLLLFWATLIYAGTAILFPQTFVFSLESLPTFIPRLCLEMFQFTVLMIAIAKAHRSSFGFIRTITIPLLLIVDVVLGYQIGTRHVIGMGLIFFTLVLLFLNHRIKNKGVGLVLFTSLNAVITISLYKYNITYFNSVVGEQLVIHSVLLIYFFILSWIKAKEHPFRMLKKKIFFLQSASEGLGSVLMSFAFMFAPASVILAAKRALAIFWSIISGQKLFQEHHVIIKLLAFALLVVGIVLLV